jgi:hypothetical protein
MFTENEAMQFVRERDSFLLPSMQQGCLQFIVLNFYSYIVAHVVFTNGLNLSAWCRLRVDFNWDLNDPLNTR